MLKVLQVIPNFAVGGAEKVVLNYNRYFDPDKMHVKTVSLYKKGNTIYDKIIETENLDVIYLDKKLGFDPRITVKLREVIRDYDPDIIHSHLYTQKYVLLGSVGARAKRFHTIHSEPEKDAKAIDKLVNRLSFRLCGVKPVALYEDMVDAVNSYYGVESTTYIRNGIDFTEYQNSGVSKRKVRESLGLPEKSFVVGHVGAFKEEKNHTFLLEIFDCLVRTKEDVYLILVGDGPLRRDVELKVEQKGLADKVIFLGIRPDIPNILNAMDVFLLPSFYEGLPLVLVEAQVAGVRCIISDTVSEAALLTNHITQVSLDAAPNKWVDAILDTTLYSAPKDNIKNYDIKIVLEDLCHIYTEALRT